MSVEFDRAPALPGWLRRHFSFDRRAARVHGERVTFVDHGPRHGLPVLLLHGNPTWSFAWRKVIRLLDEHRSYRVIAPDLLGFGTSDKPRRTSDHALSMHVERMTALAEALELDRVAIVGQDWGGPIAAGVAERLGARVRGLVFANTSITRPRRPFRATAFHRLANMPIVSDVLFRGLLFPVPVLHRVQGDPRSLGWLERAAYAWPLANPLHRAGPLGLARLVPNSDRHPSAAVLDRLATFLEQWRGPTALVWGERDPLFGRALERHRALFPRASVHTSSAGHFVQEESPELFAAALAALDRPASRVETN